MVAILLVLKPPALLLAGKRGRFFLFRRQRGKGRANPVKAKNFCLRRDARAASCCAPRESTPAVPACTAF